MEQTIRDWEMKLRLSAYSECTVSNYVYPLKRLAKAHPGKTAGEFTHRDLEQYLSDHRKGETAWSDSTYKMAVIAFRGFFEWLSGEQSPARSLVVPRKVKPKRRRRALSAAKSREVLTTIDTSTAEGVRSVALISLMLDTGLRAAEVLRVRVDEMDWPVRQLEVQVKGGRRRKAKYSVETAEVVRWWLSLRGALARPGVQTLFVSLGGTRPGTQMTRRGLGSLFTRIAKSVGLDEFSPHDLRRSFAHQALRAGGPTRVVQVGGGWENLRQLERVYSADISIDDMEPYLPAGLALRGD